MGVFATRSPHRPNPIGLTIVKIEKVVEDTVYFSGVDLVDGTPVLDIKPYVPQYDSVTEATVPEWIVAPPVVPLSVEFTEEAVEELRGFLEKGILEYYSDLEETKVAITEVLTLDPRSIYWRKKYDGDKKSTYGFCLDVLNILCVFDSDDSQRAKIIKVEDWSDRYGHGKKPKDYHKQKKNYDPKSSSSPSNSTTSPAGKNKRRANGEKKKNTKEEKLRREKKEEEEKQEEKKEMEE